MDPTILDNIACVLDTEKIAIQLRVEPDSDDYADLEKLLEEVMEIARPKAIYKPISIEARGNDFVLLDDQRMQSSVLQQHLKDIQNAFAFIATCGDEIEQWSKTITDLLHIWWIDGIKEHVLASASTFLHKQLAADMNLGEIVSINPGTIPDWPMSEQPKLFALLGDVENSIGVCLTDSMLMAPAKTVSGIYFETDCK
jgi:hypothetical protein